MLVAWCSSTRSSAATMMCTQTYDYNFSCVEGLNSTWNAIEYIFISLLCLYILFYFYDMKTLKSIENNPHVDEM